ncbi:unnamed protein product [Arctia plantaginis]|uniref:Uncharacterized protein n=1 Tax=Arctia plantaginis TaxID=874455 RepID=A0A8S1B6T3_ARCPL|nr:unnamed protein product [Arctia plantaginis]
MPTGRMFGSFSNMRPFTASSFSGWLYRSLDPTSLAFYFGQETGGERMNLYLRTYLPTLILSRADDPWQYIRLRLYKLRGDGDWWVGLKW